MLLTDVMTTTPPVGWMDAGREWMKTGEGEDRERVGSASQVRDRGRRGLVWTE